MENISADLQLQVIRSDSLQQICTDYFRNTESILLFRMGVCNLHVFQLM